MASSSQTVDSGLLDSKELPTICSLGKGLSGFVYETKWKGDKYARKDFPLGSVDGNIVFENEAKSLLGLDHPNLVKCIGYTIGDSSCSVLQEYVESNLLNTIRRRIEAQCNKESKSGSRSTSRVVGIDEIRNLLSSRLEVRKATGVNEAGNSETRLERNIVPFAVPEAVNIISQIAAGMEYLHDHPRRQFVHGDLKPKNVLLRLESGVMKVKVADFGLIRTKKKIKLVSKRAQHFEILMWKAPELLEKLLGPLNEDSDDPFTDSDTDEDVRFGGHNDAMFSPRADVYSFGLTCSYILGGKLSYPDLSLTQLRRQRMQGFRPELPSAACPNYIRDLVYSCLECDPLIRPTFPNICARLKAPQPQLSPLWTHLVEDDLYPSLDSYQKQDSLWNPGSYLKLAKDCLEAVQIHNRSQKINVEQCGYLVGKLKAAVDSASLFLEVPQTHFSEPPSIEDIATSVEILKLFLGIATEIESFVQGCCQDAWIQAAMTLTNVSDFVSSLGFDLELCQVAFCKDSATTRSLTLDEVHDINKAEVEVVQEKASHDFLSLFAKVTSELNTSLGEDAVLAGFLLRRLKRSPSKPSNFPYYRWVNDDGSSIKELFQWVKQPEHLSRGASSDVYKAMWLGRPVAKKTFQGHQENPDFVKEVEILEQLHHPNISSVFCYAKDELTCSIIMELMDEDLKSMIERRAKKDSDFPPFQNFEAINLMLQIGEGMNYLHQNGIMHTGLKSANILVKSMKATQGGYAHAKVSNFGLTKTKDCCRRYSNKTVQASKWMPPEVINLIVDDLCDGPASFRESKKKSRYSLQSDVYSFAMVCYEILTAHEPFQLETSFLKVKEKVMKGMRPYLPGHCPASLRAIIEKCWHQDPEERRTFAVICSELKYLKYSLMRGMSVTAPNYSAGKTSSSCAVEYSKLPRLGMNDDLQVSTLGISVNALSDDLLGRGVFARLPLYDLLRAQTICKRWQRIVAQIRPDTFDSRDEIKSYCPLVFAWALQAPFIWCGYDSATGSWELLPPLTNLPQVGIRPLAGNRKCLMGFRITSVPLQVVVGNPITNTWQTIRKPTETWGEMGNILVVDRDDSKEFAVIGVREDSTEVYHSKEEAWMKLRQSPPPGLQEVTVLSIANKLISPVLCGGLAFCYGSDALISFDVVTERWTTDHIRLPLHESPKRFQMLECGGNLFAAVEDVARATISIWGLGLRCREFFPALEMPPQFYSVLCRKKRGAKRVQLAQMMAVGHKHRMYFWRNFCRDIVEFDSLRRTWAELPSFEPCLRLATGNQPDPDPLEDFQIVVDAGYFEP